MNNGKSDRARFGPFEVDFVTHELWKDGAPLKLLGQPFEILTVLLTRPGELVKRDELQARLWPKDRFVDFDHGLNAAVKKLRETLNDSAENPTYIQTLPRLGYRFIALVSHEVPEVVGETAKSAKPVRTWWKIASAGTLVVVLFALGSYVLKARTGRIDYSVLTPVPLTDYPGTELAPSFSPDGNQIAFEWFQASSPTEGDLYVKQIGQEHPLRLTNHRAGFVEPAWSPDGRNIAFEMPEKGEVGVYVIPSLGGPERQLAEVGKLAPFSRISWSADSKWIAFSKEEAGETQLEPKKYRIHLVNIVSGEEREIPVASPECAMSLHPTFSPDGKYLASDCSLRGGGGNRIYVQGGDGAGAREIAFVASQIMWLDGLAWAADGHSIVYAAQGSLWRVSASGGTSEKLPFTQAGTMPAVARTGNMLAFARGTGDSKIDIWQLELTGTTESRDSTRKLAPSSRMQRSPSFSPDGKHIAFESDRSGNSEIWIADGDGSNPAQLTYLKARIGSPRWSPDGRNVAFDSSASGHSEIYVVSANGGQPRKVETRRPSAAHPYWSSDGRWIYFTSEQPISVWKVSSSGGNAVALTKEGRYFPQEAVDGKRVFYVVGREDGAELWSVGVDGGDERREEGLPKLRPDAAWTPTAKGIYFINESGKDLAVFYLEFARRKVRKVAKLAGVRQVLPIVTVSPDGRMLLYTGGQSGESDLVLVEGFH